ncbi:TorF family putative porin [Idiomarina loihiensis]|uniref:TorF family putative porin n=1 Tax=Idiomarina loihiensis TaxID=135577 RepID=UPI003157F372
MKNVDKIVLASVLSMVTFSSVNAAEFDSSANVTLSSDYVFRGISQTNEDPAIQGGFDLASDSGWYAGVWASNVGFGTGSTEADLYLGYTHQLTNDWAVDFGAIRYLYPSGNGPGADFNYNEVYTNVSYKSFTISAVYSDDYFGTGVDRFYYLAGDYEYSVSEALSLNAHLGLNKFDSSEDLTRFLGAAPTSSDNYLDWSFGMTYQLTNRIAASLNYIDTDIREQSCINICDSRFTASLTASF